MRKEAAIRLDYSTFQTKRNDIDIIADILKEAKKVERKTHIMYNCNLSYSQLETYLSFCLEVGLLNSYLDEGTNRLSYQITSKGFEFLSVYSQLKILLT
jgi:predicted transcriptional regulator